MSWSSSDRKQRLPKDWWRLRASVLKRDEYTCVKCSALATDVDHIIAGDDHSPSNLQSLCRDCHISKTVQDRTRKGREIRSRLRRRERHPGLL